MANISLPQRFLTKLHHNQEIDGIIKTTLFSFGEILEENKLYFFYEYTDHGIKHIEQVLLASDTLITDDTYSNVLTNEDVGYYILSVILHDIGMHIDLNGFNCLINGDYDNIRIKELDNLTWSDLWFDFLNEAKKFSGKQLKALFGKDDVIVRTPPLNNSGDITENDKKLIGEFIRRHHPRLAHEIAIKGFPAKPEIILFANSLDIKIRSMIGLIARSHGKDLRKCVDYIESVYGREVRKCPLGVHATYLMILLRIADYIQIDNTRVYKTSLKSKTFSSPVSAIEHKTHLAIDNIDFKWQDDPERIFVTASPKDSPMFLKLRKLFIDIQYELDISWAVLGELYGKVGDSDKPTIKYRRITSNLETNRFIQQQDYVADSFLFKTNDEIIKLLVAPLYGDNITFGVRELLQNSIDACKEREFVEKDIGNVDYSPEVKIIIEKEDDGNNYFKIIDNGLGMDIEIIKNYFLSAGASYRKSIDWQKDFIDENGKAIVRRSGRFGVGILSAFLIGKEIFVQTKNIKSEFGYKFMANLNTEQINVIKYDEKENGTLIKIRIDEEKISRFEDDNYEWTKWYTLSTPVVKYFLWEQEIVPYRSLNPDNNDSLPITWNSIDSLGYNKILWTYSDKFANAKFTCNGIVIPTQRRYELLGDAYREEPQISVFDNNAILPLTLDRNSISDQLSFANELREDIYKDLIAYLLVYENNSIVENDKIFIKKSKLNHPSLKNDYGTYYSMGYGSRKYWNEYSRSSFLNTILVSKKGFILNYNYFIQKLKKIDAVLIQLNNLTEDALDLDLYDRFVLFTDEKANSISDYGTILEADNWNGDNWNSFDARVFLKKEKYLYLFDKKTKRLSTWLKSRCKFQYEIRGFTCLNLDNPKESIFDQSFFDQNSNNLHFIREYKISCTYEGDIILNNLLQKYIGDDVVIPFSLEERKKKFPLAFKELERYMKKYI